VKLQSNYKYLPAACAFLLLDSVVMVNATQAAGFQLLEQSVTGLGRSFAGSSLAADDASAAFYNPADMLLLDKSNHLQVGATYIAVNNNFKGTYASPLPGASGADEESSNTEGVIPQLHWIGSLNDDWRMGLSITAVWNPY